jgi:DNA-directed RNA polymerase specialized sigma24 family protein
MNVLQFPTTARLDALPPSRTLATAEARPLEPADAELVARIVLGSRAAMHAIYERHVRYASGVSVRLLGRHDDHLDIVQDAFITAFAKIADLRDPDAFRAWLTQIVVRLVHRRLRRRRFMRLFGFAQTTCVAAVSNADLSVEARSELVAIQSVLDAQPMAQRSPCTMSALLRPAGPN